MQKCIRNVDNYVQNIRVEIMFYGSAHMLP